MNFGSNRKKKLINITTEWQSIIIVFKYNSKRDKN